MRKSDGTRIITIFNNNKTEAFTRSGKPYTVLGKFHEENILDQVGLEGYVIDGETGRIHGKPRKLALIQKCCQLLERPRRSRSARRGARSGAWRSSP